MWWQIHLLLLCTRFTLSQLITVRVEFWYSAMMCFTQDIRSGILTWGQSYRNRLNILPHRHFNAFQLFKKALCSSISQKQCYQDFFLCLPKQKVELQPDLSQKTANQHCLHKVYRKIQEKPSLPKHWCTTIKNFWRAGNLHKNTHVTSYECLALFFWFFPSGLKCNYLLLVNWNTWGGIFQSHFTIKYVKCPC